METNVEDIPFLPDLPLLCLFIFIQTSLIFHAHTFVLSLLPLTLIVAVPQYCNVTLCHIFMSIRIVSIALR